MQGRSIFEERQGRLKSSSPLPILLLLLTSLQLLCVTAHVDLTKYESMARAVGLDVAAMEKSAKERAQATSKLAMGQPAPAMGKPELLSSATSLPAPPSPGEELSVVGTTTSSVDAPLLGRYSNRVTIMIPTAHLSQLVDDHRCVEDTGAFWEALHSHGITKLVEVELTEGLPVDKATVVLGTDNILTTQPCRDAFRGIAGDLKAGDHIVTYVNSAESLQVNWADKGWATVSCPGMAAEKQAMFDRFMGRSGDSLPAVQQASAKVRTDVENSFRATHCATTASLSFAERARTPSTLTNLAALASEQREWDN